MVEAGTEIVNTEESDALEFNNDLEYARSSVPTITDPERIREWVLNLQKFIRLCEQPQDKLKTFKQGDTKFVYVPIDVVETEVKKLFMGLIQEHEPTWQVIGNEIVASQKFEVFHPVAGVWISVVGWGAVQIRMKKDSDITDPRNKLKNALQMDFPHLGAECFKNAMQKLGRKFGRGLRRDYLDEYKELVEPGIKGKAKKQEISDEEDEKLLEQFKSRVDHYYSTYSTADNLKRDAFKIAEEAKQQKMSELNLEFLKNHINETIKKWRNNGKKN